MPSTDSHFATTIIMKKHFLIPLIGLAASASAPAALLLNFSRTGSALTEPGSEVYSATHENSGSFTAQSFTTSFANTGAANVTVTPSFPSTTDQRVQQMIARTGGQNASWTGDNIGLLGEWIGTDTRTGNGGNGTWDGTTGTPTYMNLSLGGLAAGDYSITSLHHDTENMNSFFSIEVSTDGGANFGAIQNGRITNSTAGGNPAENEVLPGTGLNVAGGNPFDLSSTQTYGFSADGSNDVVIRYAALASTPVHKDFFVMNALQLSQVPEPSTGLLAFAGLGLLAVRRRK